MNIVNKKDGDKEVIEFVVRALREGKIIAYPTETVYGLGCDATNKRAIKNIYKLKGIDSNKQFLVLVSSLAMAKKYVVFNKAANKLAKKYWPGALTIILPTTSLGKKLFGSTLGVRVSSNPMAQAITKSIGTPLVSTSANMTGNKAAQSGAEVMEIFAEARFEPDLILDAGKLKKSKGSTIVDCTTEEKKIIRQGDVKIEL